jgi:hypothetical protein
VDGPVALGLRCSSSFFLLEGRIFIDIDVEVITSASSSGVVPDGVEGSRVWRSKIISDGPRLDRALTIFLGCCLQKARTML